MFINNVRQEPGSGKAYTAAGTTLTMSELQQLEMICIVYFKVRHKAHHFVPPATIQGSHIHTTFDLTGKTLHYLRTLSHSTTKAVDASTTTFTIASGRTVDDVLVFVNGICLVPTDDYTISGTTLTFVTARLSPQK